MTERQTTSDMPPSDSGPVVAAESRRKARRSTLRGRTVALVLAAVGGFAAPWVLFSTMDRRLPPISPSISDIVIGLIVILGLVVASAIVHELGHLLGGRVVGFRTMMFGIWPIVLVRTTVGPWRVRVHASLASGMGFVLSVPTETDNLRRRLLCGTGAGPGASLLGGVLGLAVFFGLTPERAAHSSGTLTLALVAGAGGLISLAFAFVSLLPMRDVTGDATDGARLLELLRGGKEAEVQGALSVLVGLSLSGVRPRRWDPALLQSALAAPPTAGLGEVARFFAYESALDRDNFTEARRFLHDTLAAGEHSSGKGRPEVLLEAAWFAAVHDDDPATARERFTLAGARGTTEAHERLIAEAAVLVSEGRGETAGSCLHAALEKLQSNRKIFGATEIARERIAQLFEVLGIGFSEAEAPSPPDWNT